MAYKVIDVAQGDDSPEWLEWRKGLITASEVAVVLGVSPYKTPWRLWMEKKGFIQPDDLSGNPNIKRGKALEEPIRSLVEEEFNTVLMPYSVQSDTYDFLGASLDGMDENGVIHEFKAPAEKTWIEVSLKGRDAKAFMLYNIQVQHQMAITGSTKAYLHFGFQKSKKDDLELCSFEIERDEALIEKIIAASRAFKDSMTNGIEPAKNQDLDPFVPQDEQAEEWKQLAANARRIERKRKDLKAQLDQLDSEMTSIKNAASDMFGDFKTGEYQGLRVTRAIRKGRMDWPAVIDELLPEADPEALQTFLDGFVGKESTYLTVSVDLSLPDIVYPSPQATETQQEAAAPLAIKGLSRKVNW